MHTQWESASLISVRWGDFHVNITSFEIATGQRWAESMDKFTVKHSEARMWLFECVNDSSINSRDVFAYCLRRFSQEFSPELPCRIIGILNEFGELRLYFFSLISLRRRLFPSQRAEIVNEKRVGERSVTGFVECSFSTQFASDFFSTHSLTQSVQVGCVVGKGTWTIVFSFAL